MQLENEIVALGALADSVQEVIEMEPSQIEAAPHIGTDFKTEFLKGMASMTGVLS